MSESAEGHLEQTWSAGIDRLYDAVGREEALAGALGEFLPFFDARGVTYLTVADSRYPTTSHVGSVGVSHASLVEYHSHFSAHDDWVIAAIRRREFEPGAVFRGSDLVDRAQLRRSYFWKEFLNRFGIVDSLAVVVELSSSDGPTSFLSFYRHTGQQPFTAGHARQLARLGPHLRNVLRLHRRLAPTLAVGTTLFDMVQGVDVPFLFVGADRRIVERNAAAGAALADRKGWLADGADGLQISTATGWQSIGAALEALQASGQDNVVLDLVSPLMRCATLNVRMVRGAVSDRIAGYPAVAVCTLQRGSRDRFRALRELHGLTAAEARVALQVAEGKRAADIVQATGQRLTTVRSHIASALGKLGLQRQSQLVSYVMAM